MIITTLETCLYECGKKYAEKWNKIEEVTYMSGKKHNSILIKEIS